MDAQTFIDALDQAEARARETGVPTVRPLTPDEVENRRLCYRATAEGLIQLGHYDAAQDLMVECWTLFGQTDEEKRELARRCCAEIEGPGLEAWQ